MCLENQITEHRTGSALPSKVGAINQNESSIIVSCQAILPFKGFLLDTKNKCKEDHCS